MIQERIINKDIKLIPYYQNDDVLIWYQDLQLCKQVDNRDTPYDLKLLHQMYDYLSNNGDCCYIEYQGKLVGDITLLNNGEIAIVVSKGYQNKHIGRLSVLEILNLAKEKGFSKVRANIYSFNKQSQRMFQSIGFKQIKDEWYEYTL